MLICQRTDEYNPIRLIFHLSSLFEKAKFNTVQAAIAKNCSRNALNKSANDTSNPSISIENKFGKLNGKRLIFEKSHIPTNRCSHKDNQWGTREDRLYSFSTTSMKLEHNFKTFISITYSSVQPLPFLSSPITLLPTITKRPRDGFTITPHCQVIELCTPSVQERCQLCFPTALVPTCDLQQDYSWQQPPLCFLSLVSYGTASTAPTTARLPLRVPLSPCKGRYPDAVRGRICLAASGRTFKA